jgi:xanthine dehydrogenase YagR molybdenum-binding subunit
MNPLVRTETLSYGIVEQSLEQVTRQVPSDEPPPLPPNAELKVIGKPIDRLDGAQKVTGTARFTFDVQLPGMLYARRVVSTHAHARVTAVDTSEAEKYPGVRAVHVLNQPLLQHARLRDPKAEPASRYPTVRYLGQPVAAVAAESQHAADAAAKLVNITYERLPHVTTIEEAMQEGASSVFPGPTEQPATAGGGGATPGLPQRGNVRGPDTGRMFGLPRGNAAKALAEADVVVEAEYRTQVQTHVPMEPHAMVADWRDDGLTIYASTQFTASVRDEAADLFELPKNRVRVISDFTGGGFGAKYGIGNFGLLAINLSRKAGAPVRMVLDRREEHVSSGNRPSSIQRLKVGARRDGTLTAIQLVSYGSGGVAGGGGVGFAHAMM